MLAGDADFLCMFNHLPNDKILDLSELKAFADNKLKVIQMTKLVLDEVENIVGKRKKSWLPAFSSFQKASFSGSLKVGIVW